MNEEKFKWLKELNARQQEAVMYGNGPLLIIAGAGTGKTMTLAYRVAYLVANNIPPERILLLTFTRRAAEEMLKRASNVISERTGIKHKVWGGTFHAVANRLLRMYASWLGIPADFTIIDRSDAEDLLNIIAKDLKLKQTEYKFPSKETCLNIYSRFINSHDDLEYILERYFPWCGEWKNELKILFNEYIKRKQLLHVMDYDDLLLYWLESLNIEEVRKKMEEMFDHILVDEYQDTNIIQAKILIKMRENNKNITAVGDDAQSIYGFRASTVKNILNFPKAFPGATIVKLEQNYRSVQPILDLSNAVMRQAKYSYTKSLWSTKKYGSIPKIVTCFDESYQDEFVINNILERYNNGMPLHCQAVLFRCAYLSDSLELELSKRGIPYKKYGGLKFTETAHIRDILAFLRVLENPLDRVAWERILVKLPAIGEKTKDIIINVITHEKSFKAMLNVQINKKAKDNILPLYNLLERLKDPLMPLHLQIENIKEFYEPILKNLYDDPISRMKDIENLQKIASRYSSRSDFLTVIQLDPPSGTIEMGDETINKDEDWLVLSTIHSAKGCEWDVVYIIHASDGCIPKDIAAGDEEEIEEELRIFYVALTRAKYELFVIWPLRYYYNRYGSSDYHAYSKLTRFLNLDINNVEYIIFGPDRYNEKIQPYKTKKIDLFLRLKEKLDGS